MLKNLVKENKDRAVEKNGACRFCGQIKLVEALEEFNEDELNELATEQCNCYEAQNYISRLYRKEKADCSIGFPATGNRKGIHILQGRRTAGGHPGSQKQ